MKTALIIGIIIILVLAIVFLWMFIAGADESRKRHSKKHDDKKTPNK